MKAPAQLFAWLSIILLPLSALSHAQSAQKVSPCDLVKDPQKYSGQWVEVRGTINQFFEDFSLGTGDCGGRLLRGIWLMYGADENTPVASTANDHDRKPGSVLKVSGIPVPLVRDASLDLLQRRLNARRRTMPDGSPCYDQCPFYRVDATITGLFMAAVDDEHSFSGYGHMGCCHLLAIRQVAEVDAMRTEIPAGGKFACTTDTWDMNAGEAEEAFRKCQGPADCLKPMHLVTQHWRDDVDLDHRHEFNRENEEMLWRSADLLTTYQVKPNYSNKGDLAGATATRTTCKAIEPPYPASTPVSCRELSMEAPRGKKQAADDANTWLGKPAEVAPLALDEAVRRWGIQLLPELALQQCDKPQVFQGAQQLTCDFTEPSSMQSLTVGVERRRRPHQPWQSAPWKLAQAYGLSCTAGK